MGVYARLFCEAVHRYCHGRSGGVLDEQTRFSIRLYCYGTIGMTQEWLTHDNITPAETVVEMMFGSMPENLKELFREK